MLLDLGADGPEEVLGHAALLERQVAAGEQAERHVERLLRVVESLQHVAGGDVLIGIDQVVSGCSQSGLAVVGTFSSPKPETPRTSNTSTL